ncbi:MAG: cyclase family protein [Methanospirillaceae archaeon]|nr:cyclase family protein [Methanospirillaceae archaeon]
MPPVLILSYPLRTATPCYPGTPSPIITPDREITVGDSANTSLLTIHSHTGTHIDTPYHFCRDGRTLSSFLENGKIIIDPVRIIDVDGHPDLLITPRLIAPFLSGLQNIAGLFIRTGFGRYRSRDPHTYTTKPPYLHEEIGNLLKNHCPYLMLLGIDAISVANPGQKETGRAAHRALLCNEPPILLLEDLNLSAVDPSDSGPFSLTVIPLLEDLPDGSPVVVIATPSEESGRVNPI